MVAFKSNSNVLWKYNNMEVKVSTLAYRSNSVKIKKRCSNTSLIVYDNVPQAGVHDFFFLLGKRFYYNWSPLLCLCIQCLVSKYHHKSLAKSLASCNASGGRKMQIIKGFFWIAWKHMHYSEKNGDLGFRNLKKSSDALLAKQAWRILRHSDSLLAKLFKTRYFKDKSILRAISKRKQSYGGPFVTEKISHHCRGWEFNQIIWQ